MIQLNERAEQTLRSVTNLFLGVFLALNVLVLISLGLLFGDDIPLLALLGLIVVALCAVYIWAIINVVINISLQSRANGEILSNIAHAIERQSQFIQKGMNDRSNQLIVKEDASQNKELKLQQRMTNGADSLQAKPLSEPILDSSYENAALAELLDGRVAHTRLILMREGGMSMQAADAWIEETRASLK